MKTNDRNPQGATDGAGKTARTRFRSPRVSDDPPWKLERLAFIRADHRGHLDHWAVTPSGNDDQDFETGIQYYWKALAIAEQCEDTRELLGRIVFSTLRHFSRRAKPPKFSTSKSRPYVGGAVRYELVDIEAFKEAGRRASTSDPGIAAT